MSKAVSRNQNDFKPSTCLHEGFKNIKHNTSLHSVTSTYSISISVFLRMGTSYVITNVL